MSDLRHPPALFAGTAGGEIAGTGRRFAVYEDVAGAADGDATAVGPVTEHRRRLAVYEHVLGALNDSPRGVGRIALARGRLPADRGRGAAAGYDARHAGASLALLRPRLA